MVGFLAFANATSSQHIMGNIVRSGKCEAIQTQLWKQLIVMASNGKHVCLDSRFTVSMSSPPPKPHCCAHSPVLCNFTKGGNSQAPSNYTWPQTHKAMKLPRWTKPRSIKSGWLISRAKDDAYLDLDKDCNFSYNENERAHCAMPRTGHIIPFHTYCHCTPADLKICCPLYKQQHLRNSTKSMTKSSIISLPRWLKASRHPRPRESPLDQAWKPKAAGNTFQVFKKCMSQLAYVGIQSVWKNGALPIEKNNIVLLSLYQIHSFAYNSSQFWCMAGGR